MKSHIPGIDVWRGLAVVAVILYHFDVPFARGGYVGVDLFMVISGFLITRSLLDLETKRHGLKEFYLRRARRLLPAVVVLVVVVVGSGALVMPRLSLGSLRWDAIWSLGYSVNWRFIATGASYFDTVSPPSPFRHLWSLAIEEQFYLLWPILLFRIPRSVRVAAAIALAVASVAAMHVLKVDGDPFRVYYGTDTRAQALLVGAIVALSLEKLDSPAIRRSLSFLTPLSLLALCAAFGFADATDSWMYSGPHLGLACAGGILVLWSVRTRESFDWSSLRWIGAIGRRSYSLYLWHWPVIVLVSERYTDASGVWLLTLRIILIVVLSEVSYRLFEQALQQRLITARKTLVTTFGGIAIAGVVVVGATVAAEPIPQYLKENRKVNVVTAESRRPFVRIIGDSVVESLRGGYELAARELNIQLELIVISGCGILPGATVSDLGEVYPPSLECPNTVASVLSQVDRTKTADILIWQAAWDSQNREVDGKKLFVGSDDQELIDLIRRTASSYQSLGEQVVIVTTAERAQTSTLIPAPPEGAELRRFLGSTENIIKAGSANDDRIHAVDIGALVCGGSSPCADTAPDGTRFRPTDGIHYEGMNNDAVARWVLEQAMSAGGLSLG